MRVSVSAWIRRFVPLLRVSVAVRSLKRRQGWRSAGTKNGKFAATKAHFQNKEGSCSKGARDRAHSQKEKTPLS